MTAAMTGSGAALLARGHLHRSPPGPVDDALVETAWAFAGYLGRQGESLRLDLRRPDSIAVVDDPETWGAYWPGFDRGELVFRERQGLSCEGTSLPQILLGGPSGAARACRRAAGRLRSGACLDVDDLMALLTLLHELHHASSASAIPGQDYALAYEQGWDLEEGFVYGMSVRRLPRILAEHRARIGPGAMAAWRRWVDTHPLASEYRRAQRLCRGQGGFEKGWQGFRRASLLERLYFHARVPACPAHSPVREKQAPGAA